MTEELVEVVMSHPTNPDSPFGEHATGERVEFAGALARQLVDAGYAKYATKAAAKAAGDPTKAR